MDKKQYYESRYAISHMEARAISTAVHLYACLVGSTGELRTDLLALGHLLLAKHQTYADTTLESELVALALARDIQAGEIPSSSAMTAV